MHLDPVIIRIQQALRNKYIDHTWERISEAIETESNDQPEAKIDRRALARLCKDEEVMSVKLSMAQLVALDKYLKVQCGVALFQHSQTLLDSLAEADNVKFLVASKFHKGMHTNAVSRWDLQSITTLLSTELGRRRVRLSVISESESWPGKDDANLQQGSVVSIASPIASIASDRLLASMLDLRDVTRTPDSILPFFIVRRDTTDKSVKSGFVRGRASAIAKGAEGARMIVREHRALIVDRKAYICNDNTDYAVLVAQRDPTSGYVRAVLAGLAGPSTHELAEILAQNELIRDVPPLQSGMRHPPILVAVFRIELRGTGGRKIRRARSGQTRPGSVTVDDRVVENVTPADPPVFFHYEDQTWRAELGAH